MLYNLRSGVLFSKERESIATRESAVWKRDFFPAMRCREGGYDRRLSVINRSTFTVGLNCCSCHNTISSYLINEASWKQNVDIQRVVMPQEF